MFTLLAHDIHYKGYALSLLLIQIILLMKVLGPSGTGRSSAATVAGLFLLGFWQGYLSFDHCFVVALAAVPIALVVTPNSRPIPIRSLLFLCAAPGLGFVLMLHFAQSVAYLEGIRAALDEYAFRSAKTYAAKDLVELRFRVAVDAMGLVMYACAYLRWNHLFGLAAEAMLSASR